MCGSDNYVYFHVNLNFYKFNNSAFVGEWTIYKFEVLYIKIFTQKYVFQNL